MYADDTDAALEALSHLGKRDLQQLGTIFDALSMMAFGLAGPPVDKPEFELPTETTRSGASTNASRVALNFDPIGSPVLVDFDPDDVQEGAE